MYSSMKEESFSNPFQTKQSRDPSANKESFIREWKGHGLTPEGRAGSSRPRNIISIPKKKKKEKIYLQSKGCMRYKFVVP